MSVPEKQLKAWSSRGLCRLTVHQPSWVILYHPSANEFLEHKMTNDSMYLHQPTQKPRWLSNVSNWPVGTSLSLNNGILPVPSMAQIWQIPIATAYERFAVLRKTAVFQIILLKPKDKHGLTEQFSMTSEQEHHLTTAVNQPEPQYLFTFRYNSCLKENYVLFNSHI